MKDDQSMTTITDKQIPRTTLHQSSDAPPPQEQVDSRSSIVCLPHQTSNTEVSVSVSVLIRVLRKRRCDSALSFPQLYAFGPPFSQRRGEEGRTIGNTNQHIVIHWNYGTNALCRFPSTIRASISIRPPEVVEKLLITLIEVMVSRD